MVLERVDEPKTLNSQICTVDPFDELSGGDANSSSDFLLQQGTFDNNLCLSVKWPKISLLNQISLNMVKAEICINFEPNQVILSYFRQSSFLVCNSNSMHNSIEKVFED